MRATRILGMQPTRALQMQATRNLRFGATPAQLFQRSGTVMRPMPKEEHSAHTISQRIRSLKKVPVELLPLGFVLAIAIFAALYSMGHKLWVDKQLRLTRSGGVSHRNSSDP